MRRLAFLMVGIRYEYRRQPVEGERAVWFRIGNRLAFRGRFQRSVIRLAVTERAEQREAEGVGPHVESAKRNAAEKAVSRPQRLGIAHLPEVAPNFRPAPRIVVIDGLVVASPLRKRLRNMFGGEDAGEHRVMAALDAWDIHEP